MKGRIIISELRVLAVLMACLALFVPGTVCDARAAADPSLGLTYAEKAYLVNKGQLTFACDPDRLPYERINEGGEHEGVAADYMRLLSKRVGVPFVLIPTRTWTQSLILAKSGKCDLVTMLNKTPERDVFLDFTKPYLTSPVVLMRPVGFYLESLFDLHGKTVAVVKGHRQEEEFQRDHPEIKLLLVKSSEAGLKAVANGDATASVATLVEALHFSRVNDIEGLEATGWAVDQNSLRVGVRKNNPLLLSIMRKAVDSLTVQDKARIESAWIYSFDVKQANAFSFWNILLALGGLVLVVGWLLFARKAH